MLGTAGFRRLSLVFALALALFMAFNWVLPLTDPVEAIYGQVSKEMVLSGHYLAPHIFGRPFFDKPPLTYWAAAASFRLFGFGDFAARLPGAVFAALGVAFLAYFAGALFGRRAGWLSALVMAGTLEYALLGRLLLTDLLLLVFFSACLGFFYLGWRAGREGRWQIRLAYVFAGLAVLTKGPVGLLLPGLVIAAYLSFTGGWRRWRDLCLPSGLLLFALVAAPWYLYMYRAFGADFTGTFLGVHNVLRATQAEHPADNHWWYYLALLAGGFFPWFGLVPYGLRPAWPRRLGRLEPRADAGFFLLVWAVCVFGFFTLMATKYPTYTLPAFLPLAALVGVFLDGRWQDGAPTRWWALALWQLPTAVLMLALPLAAWDKIRALDAGAWQAVLPFCLLSAAGLAGLAIALLRKNWRFLVLTLGVAGLLQIPAVLGTIVARHTEIVSTAALIGDLRRLGWRGEPLGCLENYAWSAAYYSGQAVPLLSDKRAPNLRQRSWNVKRTMPYVKPAEFMNQTGRYYLLASPAAIKRLPAALRQRVQLLRSRGRYGLYRSLTPEVNE